MQPNHRPQLIQDLSATALGLIKEAENVDPQDARALVELAGTLDKLRVHLLSECTIVPPIISKPQWISEKRH